MRGTLNLYLFFSSSIASLVWKPAHFKFQIMAVCNIKLRSPLSKNSEKCLCTFLSSIQEISRLDSQSKFQMFTLFTGRHIGRLTKRESSNMEASYPFTYGRGEGGRQIPCHETTSQSSLAFHESQICFS